MGSPLRPAGVLVPLVTPFDESGGVDRNALAALGSRVLDAGAQGIVALATTGEPSALDAAERDAVVAICAEIVHERDRLLVVGASTNDTRETLRRHEQLADIPGVAASLAVVPYYVRPSEAAIVAHFQLVAERSPAPVILYNIPYRTGQGLGADALLELAATDNIAAVKQAVGGIDTDTLRLLAGAPEDFSVLGGDDPFLAPLTLMGGRGAIAASANVATERFVQMIAAALAGDATVTRERAAALLPLVLALFAEPSPAVIKAVLEHIGVLSSASVRMPLADASPEASANAISEYERLTQTRDG